MKAASQKFSQYLGRALLSAVKKATDPHTVSPNTPFAQLGFEWLDPFE
jgi:hypothetical protein